VEDTAGGECDIAVVGAGAAGLAAGIFAAEAAGAGALRIVLLDGAAKIGTKILISGGGRCNVTHDAIHVTDFNGAKPIVRNVLAAFDEQATVHWFGTLGVELKRENTGKLFPVSDSARTVLNALLRRCAESGVVVLPAQRVHAIRGAAGGFVVEHAGTTLRARCVIMATGGRSLARTGSDGSGWTIVRHLGHTVTDTYPALVPLVLSDLAARSDHSCPEAPRRGERATARTPPAGLPAAGSMFHAELSGLSQQVQLSTFADDKLIDRRTGSLLWTHFGISGPVVMDASRHWVIARATQHRVEMRCNFIPAQRFDEVERWLIETAAAQPRLSLRKCLARQVPERFAAALAHATGIDSAAPVGQLARAPRRALVHALTAFVLPIERPRGWDYAEVTAGGVPLAEINYRTMESRRVAGLYLIGEMLDCDGRIGGYNFQWAWATGYLAGRAVVRSVMSGSMLAPGSPPATDR